MRRVSSPGPEFRPGSEVSGFKKNKTLLWIATCISFNTSHRAGRDLRSQFDLDSYPKAGTTLYS